MKTKTCILAAVALFLLPREQKAQSFTTGIQVGASTTSVSISNTGNEFVNTVNGKNILGFEGGLFERISFGPIFIKPMVLLSYQGGNASYYYSNGTVNTAKFDYGKLEIPVLVGLKIIGPLRIEGGPVYNWIYTTKFNDQNNAINVDPSGLGYRVGANVEFWILNLGLAYQGLVNKSDNSTTTTFSTPNEVIFSAAICFGGGDDK